MLVASIIFTVAGYIDQSEAVKVNGETVRVFHEIIPDVREGLIYDRTDYQMPVMELNGTDIVGLVEIPILSVEFPVYYKWDVRKADTVPCRFSGSVYDSTLIIGGADRKGQLGFTEEICVGDKLFLTDVTGERFEYVVSEIRVMKHAFEKDDGSNNDLIIFSKNVYSKGCTVIYCNLK